MKDILNKNDVGGYTDIIGTFEYDVLLQVSDDDYSGDTRVLFRDNRRYGWLQYGWGSCSGCDEYQSICDDLEELQRFQKSLHDSIKWFDDLNKAKVFFEEHDWEGDYSGREEKQKEFIDQAKDIFKQELVRYLAGV